MTKDWWSDQQNLLTRLYILERKSASVIAAELSSMFGRSFTRNAVCGALYRLGIRRPPSCSANLIEGQRAAIVKAQYQRRVVPNASPTKTQPYRPEVSNGNGVHHDGVLGDLFVADNPGLGDSSGVRPTLLELKKDMCRFPLDDGFFCGREVDRRSPSYCAACAMIVYRPSTHSAYAWRD